MARKLTPQDLEDRIQKVKMDLAVAKHKQEFAQSPQEARDYAREAAAFQRVLSNLLSQQGESHG